MKDALSKANELIERNARNQPSGAREAEQALMSLGVLHDNFAVALKTACDSDPEPPWSLLWLAPAVGFVLALILSR